MNLELALWRWSNAVQWMSVLMVAVFFAVMWRSIRHSEVRFWAWAWTADLVAMSVSTIFWFTQPPSALLTGIGSLYLGAKLAFVALLVQGTSVVRTRGTPIAPTGPFVGAAALLGFVAGFLLPSIDLVGIFGSIAIVSGLATAAVLAARERDSGLTWLSVGLGIRAAFAALEGIGYVSNLTPGAPVPAALQAALKSFVSASSSFDMGAEWLIAFGCVIATLERTQRELRSMNLNLLAAQEDLRRLVDRDPLTALANRRALPDVFRSVQPVGATLVFFDLNSFKQINDHFGHQVGDDCLRRFAAALTESFRPQDAIVRYAGDEFLVVASGLDPAAVQERVDQVGVRLRGSSRGGVAIAFSYGTSELVAGGQPDAALKAADEAMYRAKPSGELMAG